MDVFGDAAFQLLEAAILWTRTATMMHLPNTLLQDAWQRHQDHASQQ